VYINFISIYYHRGR